MTSAPDEPVELLMHRDPVTIDAGATLYELAARLAVEEVGSVLIVESGQLMGIVTERDIVVALADATDPSRATAADIMSPDPMCADMDDSIRSAAEQMAEAGILHLPVLGRGEVIGVVSARDFLAALTDCAWSDDSMDEPGEEIAAV